MATALNTALHVITTERDALSHLELLYRTNDLAQKNIDRAVAELVHTIHRGGKLVVCGVGKSGKIGRKLEATMNSVGIHSVFLHPTEALHGDLGMIRPVRSPPSSYRLRQILKMLID
jgi:D-arabinose 5-phosphate isomerase GutQ